MLGQEAVNIAQGFRGRIGLTGLVMNKMDGDARGGAAISVRSVTGIPLKFLGTGEKLDALEKFDPGRLASRILGMGDVIGLIEKAERAFDATIDKTQGERMLEGRFDREDWLTCAAVRKWPLAQIADKLWPGWRRARWPIQRIERGFRRGHHQPTRPRAPNPEILSALRGVADRCGTGGTGRESFTAVPRPRTDETMGWPGLLEEQLSGQVTSTD
jgi:signal recognition particle subunit SRP54